MRYIDAYALLAELQEEIDFETSMYTKEQNEYFKMGLKCAFRDVKNQQTADVVPRAEVAREIFEEIIKILNNAFRKCEKDEVQIVLKISRAIFELKKKYTEGKNDR